ncbi:MAG TPA: hypothetical protein VM734_09970 [Kofleriaceae bacterium]|nr:hypothetical protein [Kofleriaceae bacterium]
MDPSEVGRGDRDRRDAARAALDDKLAELERRVQATREALDPTRLFENPWVRVGLAVVVGFAAGYARESQVMRIGVRMLLTAGVRHLLRDAFGRADVKS